MTSRGFNGPLSRPVHAIILGVLALVAGHQIVRAAFPTRLISDPVFGLYFAPGKVHFDTMRLTDAPAPCRPRLVANYLPGAQLFVYADAAESGARLLLLGDRTRGDLLVMRAGQCDTAGGLPTLPQGRHEPPTPNDASLLSPPEMRTVFTDVLARYARAFGGKQRFFAWLDNLTSAVRAECEGRPDVNCAVTYYTLPADLQTMLETFRQN